MIQDDTELQAAQEQILRFERFLAEARKTESPSNYGVMAEGYLSEIQKMQAEIREYLNRVPERVEAA
jgi:D-serine dehydratase